MAKLLNEPQEVLVEQRTGRPLSPGLQLHLGPPGVRAMLIKLPARELIMQQAVLMAQGRVDRQQPRRKKPHEKNQRKGVGKCARTVQLSFVKLVLNKFNQGEKGVGNCILPAKELFNVRSSSAASSILSATTPFRRPWPGSYGTLT